jgi:hypothetical protein
MAADVLFAMQGGHRVSSRQDLSMEEKRRSAKKLWPDRHLGCTIEQSGGSMARTRALAAALVFATIMALPAAKAEALTVRDVVELSKAGLSDDVLLALIEVDRTVFTMDTPTLKMLKDAGVSEPVIIAMIRSGRQTTAVPEEQPLESIPAPPPEPEQPPAVVVERPEPLVREVPVVVPVAVPVFITTPERRADDRGRAHPSCIHYEYWGFGGKLRPDAYAPPNACK